MNLYDFSYTKANGEIINFADLKGKKILIVNTATECGLKGQFEDLEAIHQEYDNVHVVGFPCAQFANQEKNTDDNMVSACKLNFGVTFDLSKRIDVNGADADPLFKYLCDLKGGKIKWNFTKFLFDENGEFIKRYSPITNPKKITKKL